MVKRYQIHPGIGIARLGNSPTEFYLSPEKPAAMPIACDSMGNPLLSPDGTKPVQIKTFKDGEGRIKRQGAVFKIFVHDDDCPAGRELRIGDRIAGGGNEGTLVAIEWRVHLANKKAVWYDFEQLQGEHGYSPDQPLRNADITDSEARQQLIIDPGPQVVDSEVTRKASFARGANPNYAQTFPPQLSPNNIDTLGDLIVNDAGNLVVLGGHGNSGSFKSGFGQPRIDHYANNDGWFDDTSDGPVMARLKMYAENIGTYRYLDVEGPAWVVSAYPRYVPQILDMITAQEVITDMNLRYFATDTSLFGAMGSFENPQQVDQQDPEALAMWRAQILGYNSEFYPWFNRDIWPILSRPWFITWLTDVLSQSNFPHDQTDRGTFFKQNLSQPPAVDQKELADHLMREATEENFRIWVALQRRAKGKKAADVDKWPAAKRDPEWKEFYKELVERYTRFCLRDPYAKFRRYLYNTLRLPSEENVFREMGRPHSRTSNAPLMPLLSGDNPISNTLPSKFLRLTDTQLFMLKQWMEGKFVNDSDGPFSAHNRPPGYGDSGCDLDYAVLSNAAGGAFCPGCEIGWNMRNPSIYSRPYRIKADPSFANFGQTAASYYATPRANFEAWTNALSQTLDLEVGLQPGDLTQQMGLPWQADFNECSTQNINVTYENWNVLYPSSENDLRLARAEQVWETLWWPAHRPMQTLVVSSLSGGQPSYQWREWAYGIPQTNAGDFKMVTSWADLGFVIENPFLTPEEKASKDTTTNRYIAVEYKKE